MQEEEGRGGEQDEGRVRTGGKRSDGAVSGVLLMLTLGHPGNLLPIVKSPKFSVSFCGTS